VTATEDYQLAAGGFQLAASSLEVKNARGRQADGRELVVFRL